MLADELGEYAAKAELLKRITQINQDVLGVYIPTAKLLGIFHSFSFPRLLARSGSPRRRRTLPGKPTEKDAPGTMLRLHSFPFPSPLLAGLFEDLEPKPENCTKGK
jgi:hypothetical protein